MIRTLWVGLAAAAGVLLSTAAFGDPPSVKLLSGVLVAPTAAMGGAWSSDYFGSATKHSPGDAHWSSTPPEIVELGRALGAGRLNATDYTQAVYQYIRNNINTEFRFGLSKGARGALIDQSGTPFDQAHLMVQLLLQGNVTGVSYQVGTISLTAQQFGQWTGLVTNLTQSTQLFSVNAQAACQLLADGGIPASVSGQSACAALSGTLPTSGTPVVMGHIWVTVHSGSGDTFYDPSFRTLTLKASTDIAAQMQCEMGGIPNCGATLLATTNVPNIQCMSGATPSPNCPAGDVPYVANVSQTNVESQLHTWAVNLQQAIRQANATNLATNPSAQIEDVAGGAVINTNAPLPSSYAALPYPSAMQYPWPAASDIPDQFRTTLIVTFPGIAAETLYADETAGSPLRIFAEAVTASSTPTIQSALYSDTRLVAGGTSAALPDLPQVLTLSVKHPYAGGPGYANETLTFNEPLVTDQCHYSNSIACGSLWRGGVLSIVQSYGNASESSVAHYAALQQRDVTHTSVENPGDPRNIWPFLTPSGTCNWNTTPPAAPQEDPGCREPTLPTTGATYLAQASRALQIVGDVNGVVFHQHHTLGALVSGPQLNWAGSPEVVLVNIQTTLSGDAASASPIDRGAGFLSAAALLDRIEGSVLQQQGDSWLSGDGVGVLVTANAQHSKLLDINGTNVNTALQSYMPTWTADNNDTGTITTYAQSGYSLIVPQASTLGLFTDSGGSQTGYAFTAVAAYTPDSTHMAYLTTNLGWDKGASGNNNPDQAITNTTQIQDYSVKQKKYYGVDLATGALTLSPPPDLVTGTGAFPYSLSYQRSYTSSSGGLRRDGHSFLRKAIGDMSELPRGWTHNFAIAAVLTQDGFAALGHNSALQAANFLVAARVLRDLNLTVPAIRPTLASAFVANWFGTSTLANVVAVQEPPKTLQFVRLADGTFDTPPAEYARLVQTGQGAYFLGDLSNGHWTYSGLTLSLTHADGSVLTFEYGYDDAKTAGIGLFREYVPQSWTFRSGVTLSFTYDTSTLGYATDDPHRCLVQVANNLGRQLNFNNICQSTPQQGSPPFLTPLWVNDEGMSANRQVNLNLVADSADGTAYQYLMSSLQVTAPGQSSPTRYDYSPRPATGINRSYYEIYRWFTPRNPSAPFMTASFDSLYRIATLTDVAARTTTYFAAGLYGSEYQKLGEISQIAPDGSSAITTDYFDHFNQKVEEIDPLGRITMYTYDTARNMTATLYPELNSDMLTYDLRHNVLSRTHISKPTDTLAAVTSSTTYYEGPTVVSCVNAATCNSPSGALDALHNQTTYTFDPTTGLPTEVLRPADPNGVHAETSYGYGVYGGISLPTSVTQKVDAARTRVSSFNYNTTQPFELKNRIVDPSTLNLTTQYFFASDGDLSSIIDPRLNTTVYQFDAMRRLQTVTAPLGALTSYCYDADSELTIAAKARVASPAALNCSAPDASQWQLQQYAYNPDGTLANSTDPESHLTSYTYDSLARKAIATDPDGRSVATAYDNAGQELCTFRGWVLSAGIPSASNCAGWSAASYDGSGPVRIEATSYTGNGKKQAETDADNNTTQYVYDGLDRLKYSFFPDPSTGQACTGLPCSTGSTYEQLTYYNSGGTLCSASAQPCSKRTRNGQTIGYTYDALDHLASRSPQGLASISIQSTLLGEPRLIGDGTHSIQYDYDGGGRKEYEENDNRMVSYGYDSSGNRNQLTWPDGYVVSYVFDALNRMTDVWEGAVNGGTHLANYSYDPLSRRGGMSYPSSASSNTVSYGYFEPGNRLQQLTNTLSPASVVFTYGRNGSGQIKSVTASDGFYLPVSNIGTVAYSPNRLNEYGSVGGGPATYDLDGNLQSWVPLDGSGVQTYSYDVENRLRTVAVGGSLTPSIFYDYDPLGRRITKTVGGTDVGVGGIATGYLLDGDAEIAEYAVSGGTWSLLRRYISGPAVDERIAHVEGAALIGAPKTYYHVNSQNSVLAMTDSTGATTQQLSYDEYGNLSSGSVATGEQFRFTGRRFDPETGLYYYRARYYSPALGRFLQTDRVGYADDLNLYAYTGNDPLNGEDPTGEDCVDPTTGPCETVVVVGKRAQKTGQSAAIAGLTALGVSTSEIGVGDIILIGVGIAVGLDELHSAHSAHTESQSDIIDDLSKGGEDKGNHVEVDRRGGDQSGDFDKLAESTGNPTRPIDTQYGPGKSVQLKGGGSASSRPGSSTGPGTIQINRPGEQPIKIRY